MKKLLLAALALFVLTGCGADATITSPRNEALFTIEGTTVTEADLFNVMNFNDAGAVVLTYAQQAVLDVVVPDDEAFQEALQQELESTIESYGELWETILGYYGFETDEEFAQEVLAQQVQMRIALTNAMTDDFDNMIDGLYVRKAAILQVAKDDAEAALAALEDGTDWEEVAEEFAQSSATHKGEIAIYTKDSSGVDSTALSHIISATETGISEALDIPNNTSAQFIINIIEVDATAIKDEVIEHFTQDSDFQTKYISRLLHENGFKVFDKNLHSSILSQFPDALAN